MNYPLVRLDECSRIVSGATPSTTNSKFWGGDIFWVTPADLSKLDTPTINSTPRTITTAGLDSCAAELLPPWSVLFSSRAPIGHVAINTVPMATNQGFKSFVPNPNKLDARYLYHWLKHNRPYLESLGNGATFKEVSKAVISRVELPLPPLDQQQRIAAILDQADDLRRKRRNAYLKADQLAHAIYNDKFGDPVANPLGHPSTTLGAMNVEMEYGPRFYNETYSDDGIRIVRITDLSETGELNFAAMPRLSVSGAELEKHRSRPGELLFARTGATVGKLALISPEAPICIPGAYFIRLQFPDDIDPVFAWYTLRSRSIQAIILEGSRQSAQQNFSGPGLRRLPFVVPPLTIQRSFAARVAEIDKLKGLHSAQLSRLDALFGSLRHNAFAGEL